LQLEHQEPQQFETADSLHRDICFAHRRLFSVIAEIDRKELWADEGARDIEHWLWMRYGLTHWKASRWVDAAHALEQLPILSEAFSSGELGVDKVVELTRFATPETEANLVSWARRVSPARIRHEANLRIKKDTEQAKAEDQMRSVTYGYTEDGRRFWLLLDVPADQGSIVKEALGRRVLSIPVMPGEEGHLFDSARTADAFVTLCSEAVAADPDPDRATVVVHAELGELSSPTGVAEIEGDAVIHAETAKRLLCNGRVQTVIENEAGDAVGMGRLTREPSAAMLRQLKYRDRECRFPGCGSRRFTQAHHIVWWRHGGRTDLDNLVLICTFHHKLVHEYQWKIRRLDDGAVEWFRPDRTRYRAGPAPPLDRRSPQPSLSTVAV
jgi:hypothetical protein